MEEWTPISAGPRQKSPEELRREGRAGCWKGALSLSAVVWTLISLAMFVAGGRVANGFLGMATDPVGGADWALGSLGVAGGGVTQVLGFLGLMPPSIFALVWAFRSWKRIQRWARSREG